MMQLSTLKTMLFTGLLSICLTGSVTTVSAQTNTSPGGKLLNDGYTRLPDGLEYKVITHGNGKKTPEVSDHVELFISCNIGDSLLFDTRKMNNNKAMSIPMANPKTPGDVMSVIKHMVAGDSVLARFSTDTLKKIGQAPQWCKPGDMAIYKIKLKDVKTDAEYKKEEAEYTSKQRAIDNDKLETYFKEHNIKANKTASGLYYSVEREGQGENIKAGQKVGVNYTGRFLSGKKFDSNTDTAFHHVQLFTLEVGMGKVIKGWDEGLQLLKPGCKATLYVPSLLAYGAMDRQGIPANSILIFDVEPVEVANYAKVDDGLIKAYLAKNNIQATKTASGLYYVINQKGLGETAKPGLKLTVNYTGKTLDGKVFDSNVDAAFGHVQPFSFALGQGQVIRGWDEGGQLLKLGSKATFFIPSGLAYGEQGAGASIPPNTVLMFDVEVTGIDK